MLEPKQSNNWKVAEAKNEIQIIDKGTHGCLLQRLRKGLNIPNTDQLGFNDFSDLSDLTIPEEKLLKPWVMVNGKKIKLTKDPKRRAREEINKLQMDCYKNTQRKVLVDNNHEKYKEFQEQYWPANCMQDDIFRSENVKPFTDEDYGSLVTRAKGLYEEK